MATSTAPGSSPSMPSALVGAAAAPALHVMSFNLRVGSAGLFDPWADRRAAAAAVLRAELPTVMGTQEGLYYQIGEVAADLPDQYAWIGTGREGGSHGEFMAVFYDTRRLEPREYDHFWLSDTPATVGSSSWGNKVVRMATWARFTDRETGRDFVVLNTHLDHAVAKAQRLGAELVAARLAEFDPALPVVVTGDFNCAAEASEPYDALVGATGSAGGTGGTGGLVDTWTAAEDRRTPAYQTFHGYDDAVEGGDRIDWILVSPGVRVRAAAINIHTVDGKWPSDHWPVHALLELG